MHTFHYHTLNMPKESMLWAFNNERHAVGMQFIGHAQGKTSFNIHIWATAANLTERQKVRGKEIERY